MNDDGEDFTTSLQIPCPYLKGCLREGALMVRRIHGIFMFVKIDEEG
jgi:hypothetical protein